MLSENNSDKTDSLSGVLGMHGGLSRADLSDYLLTRTLLNRVSMKLSDQPSAKYDSEKKLWNDISNSNLADSQNIVLEKFNVMEWIPRSPGLYHTDSAAEERRHADGFVSEKFDTRYVYEPYGKLAMVRGGVGCLRLLPKQVGDETLHFLSGTNSGIVHKGFVLAMKQNTFSKISEIIGNKGAFSAKIKGEIRFLFDATQDLPMFWDKTIPRAYLLIKDLSDIGTPEPDNFLDVTAAVTFGHKDARYQQEPMFTYSHFDPTKKNDIDKCVNWIDRAYVQEYQNGVVLTDFDEKQSHFPNTIFPVTSLMNQNLTEDNLFSIYQELKMPTDALSALNHLIVSDN